MKPIYLRGVNGVRALAGIVVNIAHTLPVIYINSSMGAEAVTVFFVLSGFLITYLLLEEKKFKLRQLEQELDNSKNVFDAIITARNSFSNTRLYHGIEGINTTLLEMANDGQAVFLLYDANALSNFVDKKLFHRSYTQRTKK